MWGSLDEFALAFAAADPVKDALEHGDEPVTKDACLQ